MSDKLLPSAELAQRVRDLYSAMEAGEADKVESFYSLAPGTVFVGSDDNEYWTVSAQHNADVRPYWRPHGVLITPGAITASAIDDMGFSVDRPIFAVGDRTWRLRITLVWQREADGIWRVVQSHASVGQR